MAWTGGGAARLEWQLAETRPEVKEQTAKIAALERERERLHSVASTPATAQHSGLEAQPPQHRRGPEGTPSPLICRHQKLT